jgi:hypothetical protein
VNQWLDAARISSGGTVIHGPTLQLLAPCIGNNFDLKGFLVKSMNQSRVPTRLVGPIAEELSAAWTSWPGSVSGSAVVFPSFAGVPARAAPPTPAIPMPLRFFLKGDPFPRESTLLLDLTQDTAPFANDATGNRASALKALATWVQWSWRVWPAVAMVVGLVGEGPVPSFAPPKVPAGPVVGGKARSTGPLFAVPFGLPGWPAGAP